MHHAVLVLNCTIAVSDKTRLVAANSRYTYFYKQGYLINRASIYRLYLSIQKYLIKFYKQDIIFSFFNIFSDFLKSPL
jgi:hypothetical protein